MDSQQIYNVGGECDNFIIYHIQEMQKIYTTGCITFTVIAVGREEITYDIMKDTYANITENVFAVTSFNCLDKLQVFIW